MDSTGFQEKLRNSHPYQFLLQEQQRREEKSRV